MPKFRRVWRPRAHLDIRLASASFHVVQLLEQWLHVGGSTHEVRTFKRGFREFGLLEWLGYLSGYLGLSKFRRV